MRVLNIIQKYYPSRGGAELAMQTLSEYLVSKLGYDVDVWTTDAFYAEALWDLEGKFIEQLEEDINGVHVRRFPLKFGIFNHKYINKVMCEVFKRMPFFKLSNLFSSPTVWSMLKEVKQGNLPRYDYVTVSAAPSYFLFYVGYLISKMQNIPYIVMPALHLDRKLEPSLRKKYYRKMAIPFYEHADKIILNTQSEGELLYEFCKDNGVVLDKEKFVVTGQGVFLDKISGGNGKSFREKYGITKPIVFQIGAKSIEKGSYNLVEAMKKVWDLGTECQLVFAGMRNDDFSTFINGQEEKYKRNILNIDDISESEKWDLYDAGDIYSMISKTDSFGIVYLEAWSYKKPVLGCDNNVIKEVISDGNDGFLIKFDDIEGISDKIMMLLKDNSLREKLGTNGYNKVKERYDWKENLKVFDKVYK